MSKNGSSKSITAMKSDDARLAVETEVEGLVAHLKKMPIEAVEVRLWPGSNRDDRA